MSKNLREIWDCWLAKYAGKRVMLYGAGEHTQMLEKHLVNKFYDMPIEGILDQNPKEHELFGYSVIQTSSFDFSTIDFVIISSRYSENAIFEQLKKVIDESKIGRFYQFTRKEIFENIYLANHWGSKKSISGPGSANDQTKVLVNKLPKILSSLSIKSLLDIPCGDFNWMQYVVNEELQYIGADIVGGIVEQNIAKYKSQNVSFLSLDLLKSALPNTDAILCRDCLVHFSNEDIVQAIDNISQSGAEYFITTNFSDVTENKSIETGGWRPLNLCIAPFNFPEPLMVLLEECTENNGKFKDKSLSIWKIQDISLNKDTL